MQAKLVVVLVLVLLAVLFMIQNVAVVEVAFLFWKLRISRALLLFLVLVAGVAAGWVLRGLAGRRKRRRETAGEA